MDRSCRQFGLFVAGSFIVVSTREGVLAYCISLTIRRSLCNRQSARRKHIPSVGHGLQVQFSARKSSKFYATIFDSWVSIIEL
jgi:hypothetical protein